MTEEILLGVIGGSGLYSFEELENQESIEIDTPFGKPSSPIVIGKIKVRKSPFSRAMASGMFIRPRMSTTAPTSTLSNPWAFALSSASARLALCVKITRPDTSSSPTRFTTTPKTANAAFLARVWSCISVRQTLFALL